MRRRLRQLHAQQGGFSLPELITAMGLGIVVLLAAAFLLDNSVSKSNQIADRQEANQRGRIAMELISRDVRSQVCLKDQSPITIGEDQRIAFYASLSTNPDTADLRTIRYDTTTKKIIEDVVAGAGTFPDLTFTSAATQRMLLEGTQPIVDGVTTRPIFRYYGYLSSGTGGQLQQLATPLSAANKQRVVLIKVGFVVLPTRTLVLNTTARDSTTFETDVYVRLADPTKPLDGPRCI
jgi:type II secretory pathway pseudopilin PulG